MLDGIHEQFAEGGHDILTGGPGNDVIDARDGADSADEIDCGDGDDTVLVDSTEDGVVDCETVVEPKTG